MLFSSYSMRPRKICALLYASTRHSFIGMVLPRCQCVFMNHISIVKPGKFV